MRTLYAVKPYNRKKVVNKIEKYIRKFYSTKKVIIIIKNIASVHQPSYRISIHSCLC